MRSDSLRGVGLAEHRSCLLLYTKPAYPGRVKTRLIGAQGGRRDALSAEQTARLHAAFLGDLGERLAGGRFHLRVAWSLEAGESFPEGLVAAADHVFQAGADLGARLFNGLAAAAKSFPRVAAVGSDHPELGPETVEQAFAALAGGADAAFGPVEDGGYYLVALRADAVRRELFEGIPWSTGEVLAQSLERCRRLGLEVAMLPPGHDVDVGDDLRRLAARLQASARPDDCPRTRALLTRWGWL